MRSFRKNILAYRITLVVTEKNINCTNMKKV